MDLTIITKKIPRCKTCNKPMKGWYMFANTHEHTECSASRIAASLVDLMKKELDSYK
jgi:hypothetical protein